MTVLAYVVTFFAGFVCGAALLAFLAMASDDSTVACPHMDKLEPRNWPADEHEEGGIGS